MLPPLGTLLAALLVLAAHSAHAYRTVQNLYDCTLGATTGGNPESQLTILSDLDGMCTPIALGTSIKLSTAADTVSVYTYGAPSVGGNCTAAAEEKISLTTLAQCQHVSFTQFGAQNLRTIVAERTDLIASVRFFTTSDCTGSPIQGSGYIPACQIDPGATASRKYSVNATHFIVENFASNTACTAPASTVETRVLGACLPTNGGYEKWTAMSPTPAATQAPTAAGATYTTLQNVFACSAGQKSDGFPEAMVSIIPVTEGVCTPVSLTVSLKVQCGAKTASVYSSSTSSVTGDCSAPNLAQTYTNFDVCQPASFTRYGAQNIRTVCGTRNDLHSMMKLYMTSDCSGTAVQGQGFLSSCQTLYDGRQSLKYSVNATHWIHTSYSQPGCAGTGVIAEANRLDTCLPTNGGYQKFFALSTTSAAAGVHVGWASGVAIVLSLAFMLIQ